MNQKEEVLFGNRLFNRIANWSDDSIKFLRNAICICIGFYYSILLYGRSGCVFDITNPILEFLQFSGSGVGFIKNELKVGSTDFFDRLPKRIVEG